MFEGKQQWAQASADSATGTKPLRKMIWADLAARLAAMRDLRAEIDSSSGVSAGVDDASFASLNEQGLNEQGLNEQGLNEQGLNELGLATYENEQISVNPENSGNCKGITGKQVPPANEGTARDPRK